MVFTEVSVLLWQVRPRPDPQSDEHLAGQARRLGECVVARTGQRQERGLLNQPAIQRPSINPPNGLGWGT